MNQLTDFSFVDLKNATLCMEKLTEYLASLKKQKLLRSVLFHYTVSVT